MTETDTSSGSIGGGSSVQQASSAEAQSSGAGGASSGDQPSSGITAESVQQWLNGNLSPELIDAVPGLKRLVDGRVGELADRLSRSRAREMAQTMLDEERRQWESQREYQARINRRESILREGNQEAAIVELQREHAAEAEFNRQQAEQARARDVTRKEMDGLWESAKQAFHDLPFELQKKLENKHYGNDPKAAIAGFWKDIAAVTAEARAEELAEAKSKGLREALEKEARAGVNGSNPVPDSGAGGRSGGSRQLDDREWQSNRGDMTWVAANKQRIIEAASAGRISGGRRR